MKNTKSLVGIMRYVGSVNGRLQRLLDDISFMCYMNLHYTQ